MIDKHLVEHKLRRLENFIREIRGVEIESFSAFASDVVKKRFIERNIQLSIEEMIDICKHLTSALDLPSTETYIECLTQLAGQGVFDKGHLDVYKKMVGFRNRLLHGYEDMDGEIIYGVYKKGLKDFELFINDIRGFLSSLTNKLN